MATTKIEIGQKSGGLAAFLILSVISLAIAATGLILGVEPRLAIERTAEREFRVTATNHFAGRKFYTKVIEGVSEVLQDDAVRDRRIDSARENRRRRQQKHLDFFGRDGARVGWDRETDQTLIEEYMRGNEKTLALADPPPTWRMIAAWFCIVLGGLSFIGAIQNSIFPKRPAA